ncbi:hypothetical protein BG005_002999 [Podila minutissima]|nr:hypothetical protein BG005_002999 [Podila minutissima]
MTQVQLLQARQFRELAIDPSLDRAALLDSATEQLALDSAAIMPNRDIRPRNAHNSDRKCLERLGTAPWTTLPDIVRRQARTAVIEVARVIYLGLQLHQVGRPAQYLLHDLTAGKVAAFGQVDVLEAATVIIEGEEHREFVASDLTTEQISQNVFWFLRQRKGHAVAEEVQDDDAQDLVAHIFGLVYGSHQRINYAVYRERGADVFEFLATAGEEPLEELLTR